MSTQFDRTAWLVGSEAVCRAHPPVPKQAYHMILLGAPGVGKGTQAELLSERLGACHLSTGDVFRAAKTLPIGQQTPAIRSALDVMRRGGLVPDETVLELIRERARCLHCPCGFILDGFPRTVAQAEALEKLLREENLPLMAVIDYELPEEEIVLRLAARRVCAKCRGITNSTQAGDGKCPQCGGALMQREDDRPEAIRVRMAAYRKSTAPLIEFYRGRNLLVTIRAEGEPAEILRRTIFALDEKLVSGGQPHRD